MPVQSPRLHLRRTDPVKANLPMSTHLDIFTASEQQAQ